MRRIATADAPATAATTAYKQQVSDRLIGAAELSAGPIALELAFVVGARRNWLNLWKPTIDALDRLLGRTHPDRGWFSARNTRTPSRSVVELGPDLVIKEPKTQAGV